MATHSDHICSEHPDGEHHHHDENVDPSQAQGAQIPMQSFNVPEFPPEAKDLKLLTLTSDIKLDEYQSLLTQPFHIPPLPTSIESLNLELFPLGYPPGFLGTLADRLPGLKSLVVYSQLFGGVSAESEADCVDLFRKLPGLRALHLLDVFAKAGFITSVSPSVKATDLEDDSETARKGLMFLEVNYTVQHHDGDFLPSMHASELPLLVGPGLITASFNVSEADVTDDPDDPNNLIEGRAEEQAKNGIMACNKTLAQGLVKALTEEETRPRNLRVLNTTLFTMTSDDLEKIVAAHPGLLVLSVTLEVDNSENFHLRLVETISKLPNIEQIEIVASPNLQFFMEVQNTRTKALERTMPDLNDMLTLERRCPHLTSLQANILRSSAMDSVGWTKTGLKGRPWEGGFKSATTRFSDQSR